VTAELKLKRVPTILKLPVSTRSNEMIAIRLTLFAFLSSFLVVAHAAKKDAFTTTIQWRLSLDTDGKI
jgi:hypothetical protein